MLRLALRVTHPDRQVRVTTLREVALSLCIRRANEPATAPDLLP